MSCLWQCLGQADPPAPIKFNQIPSKPLERPNVDLLGPYTTRETLEVRMDNGRQFNANEAHQYMKGPGFLYRTVTPLWPQATGEAESFMKPLNKAIRAAQLEGLDWREKIYSFLLAYRTTPQCSTCVAPARLLSNHEVRSTIPMSPEKREVVYKERAAQQSKRKCGEEAMQGKNIC